MKRFGWRRFHCVYSSSGWPLWLQERRPDWLYRQHDRPQNDDLGPMSVDTSDTTVDSCSAQVMRLDLLCMHGFV